MMNVPMLSVVLLLCTTINEPTTQTLDGSDGLAYIEMAEDLLATGKSDRAIQFARKCYVLSTFVNPALRRSAMLGLIDIEDNEHRSGQLISSLPSSRLLLGKVVVHVDAVRPVASAKAVFSACKELQNLRTLDKIQITKRDVKRIELLRFASLSLPITLRQVLLEGGKIPRTQQLSRDSLQAELELLGGTTQWSAAVLVEGNVPLSVTGSIDLAALMGVDTSTYLFENGKWHAPK
jgi:hypothetical protein